MRYLIACALLCSACGDSPAGPSETFVASLELASGPALTACGATQCTYTVAVVNNGPDCAERVSVSILLTSPVVNRSGFNHVAIGLSAPGIVRAGQVVTLNGSDWPAYGLSPQVTVTGAGAACR